MASMKTSKNKARRSGTTFSRIALTPDMIRATVDSSRRYAPALANPTIDDSDELTKYMLSTKVDERSRKLSFKLDDNHAKTTTLKIGTHEVSATVLTKGMRYGRDEVEPNDRCKYRQDKQPLKFAIRFTGIRASEVYELFRQARAQVLAMFEDIECIDSIGMPAFNDEGELESFSLYVSTWNRDNAKGTWLDAANAIVSDLRYVNCSFSCVEEKGAIYMNFTV